MLLSGNSNNWMFEKISEITQKGFTRMLNPALEMMKPMTSINKNKHVMGLFMLLLLIVTGCSSSYQTPPHQQPPHQQLPQMRSQANTQLPEVVRPQVRRQTKQKQKPRISRRTVQRPPVKQRPRVAVKPKRKPISRNKPTPVATVHRYSDKPKTEVITQREVQSVLKAPMVKKPLETRSEVGAYASIPDSPKAGSSPAVKSLMIRARADMAIGRDQSAISKIERALRIESDNGELWYLLAKAHQASSNHQQAIAMAKKAVNFAGPDESLAIKSWRLIKLSGEASGDTLAVQEALNYSKVNP